MNLLFTTLFFSVLAVAWEYQLVNRTSPAQGLLLVRPNATAPWGTVCDDEFGNWEATVACGSPGINLSGPASALPLFGGGTGPIYMDEVYCPGSAKSLGDCQFASFHDCSHREDVGLHCQVANATWEFRTAGTNYSNLGRLEVRPNSSADWGVVCAGLSNSQAFAEVACASLGFTNATQSMLFQYDPIPNLIQNRTLYMQNIHCSDRTLPSLIARFRFRIPPFIAVLLLACTVS